MIVIVISVQFGSKSHNYILNTTLSHKFLQVLIYVHKYKCNYLDTPLAFDYQGEHQKTAFFRKIDFEKHPNIVKNGQQKNL